MDLVCGHGNVSAGWLSRVEMKCGVQDGSKRGGKRKERKGKEWRGKGVRGGGGRKGGCFLECPSPTQSIQIRENYVGRAYALTFWLQGFLPHIIRGD